MVIKNNTSIASSYASKDIQTSKTKNSEKTAENSVLIKDSVDIGTKDQTVVTYSKNTSKKNDTVDFEKIKAQAEQATNSLKSLVENLILKQGKINNSLNIDYSLSSSIQEAQSSISDDGEWGVKAVSDRIVDFAKAISGGDKDKLAELTAAIDKGFKEAAKSLGGELPDICNQTYNQVMKKLNDWKNEE